MACILGWGVYEVCYRCAVCLQQTWDMQYGVTETECVWVTETECMGYTETGFVGLLKKDGWVTVAKVSVTKTGCSYTSRSQKRDMWVTEMKCVGVTERGCLG